MKPAELIKLEAATKEALRVARRESDGTRYTVEEAWSRPLKRQQIDALGTYVNLIWGERWYEDLIDETTNLSFKAWGLMVSRLFASIIELRARIAKLKAKQGVYVLKMEGDEFLAVDTRDMSTGYVFDRDPADPDAEVVHTCKLRRLSQE